MTKAILSRGASFVVSGVTVFLGFAGHASALTSSISDTGPFSHNTISNENENNCTVRNTNTVSANTRNNQFANTGDATVSGNTNGGWGTDDWGSMSPSAWRAQGRSYAEWQAAFTSYMASHQTTWADNWGGQGSNGFGGATSGGASNSANTTVGVNLSNTGGNCAGSFSTGGGMGGGGSISNTGPGSHNAVLGENTSSTRLTNRNTFTASTTNDQGAVSGESEVSGNTFGGGGFSGNAANRANTGVSGTISNSGGMGGGAGGTGGGTGTGSGGFGGSISNTGPGSRNTIVNSSENSFSSTNTNTVHVSTSNNQFASSGDATVSWNTHGGSATSGDASNSANTWADVAIRN